MTYKFSSGPTYAIAAGCGEAVAAAKEMLDRGGNVVDAISAAAAAACVAMPHMTGLGGDLFALVAMRGMPVVSMNATGAAPQGATIAAYKERGLDVVPIQGGLSAQTPATPHGLQAMVERWGTKSLSEILTPALRLASEGFIVGRRLSECIHARKEELAGLAGWQAQFVPGGVPLQQGAVFKQPQLAATLREFGEQGATALFDGWVGADIAAAAKADGGLMTHEDVRSSRAEFNQPLECKFGDVTVFTQPPVAQGFVLLRALSLLEKARPSKDELWVEATRALRQAFGERLDYLADSPNSRETAQRLLTSEPRPRRPHLRLSANEGGDTTAMSIIDAQGNAASVILSVFNVFGSGVVAPKSGVILNNRLSGFFLDEHYPNHLAPRQRSMHTLHSFLVTDEDGVLWAGGSPGADHQPQANLHVLLHLLAAGENPGDAVSAPRWSVLPGTEPKDICIDMPQRIDCEPGVSPKMMNCLADLGDTVRELPARTVGSSKLVGRVGDGTVGAWADNRREGAVGAG